MTWSNPGDAELGYRLLGDEHLVLQWCHSERLSTGMTMESQVDRLFERCTID
jgi:hypothetical protein